MAGADDEVESIYEGAATRLVGLADGVFSIVMTLMVFNIALPKDRPVGDLGRALLELWPSFLAFGVSFALVGIYWTAHHAMFRVIRCATYELGWLNILFLAFVSLVPFSTSLLSNHHTEPVALAVYGGNLTLIGLSLLPLWRHAVARGLLAESTPPAVVKFGRSRCVVGALGYGTASLLAFVNTPAALVLFAALPLLYLLPPAQRAWLRLYGLGPTGSVQAGTGVGTGSDRRRP